MSTASLVFSGRKPVAARTAERVRAAAAEIGYTGPDPLASSLRHGRSGIVGVLVEDGLSTAFRDPYALTFHDGLAAALDGLAGMLLLSQHSTRPDAVLPTLATTALDAAVFATCSIEDNPAVAPLAARGVPLFGSGSPNDPAVTQVRIDDLGAFAELAEYVHGLGHTRVATVTMPLAPSPRLGPVPDGPARYRVSADRLAGFRRVFPDGVAVQCAESSSVEGGLAAGTLLLGGRHRPTAILAQSDVIAAGIIRAATELGIDVPGELSVTGFDGVELPWLGRRLTTVAQDGYARGRAVGKLVLAAIAGEPVVEPPPLPTELRIGDTTAPPP